MDLFDTLSQALEENTIRNRGQKQFKRALSRKGLSGEAEGIGGTTTKPVLQLNAIPMTLNPKDYKNALSSENPDGSLAALWAFRQLVDPIPSFSRYYNPSNRSTESVYSTIINGVTPSNGSPFVKQVIADSKKALTYIRYANMDRTPGTWAPVQATPSDWYETNNKRYKTIDFDLSKAGSPNSPFSAIGGQAETNVLQFARQTTLESKPIDVETKVKKIQMKYLEVALSRQWYNEVLFSMNGWDIQGQPEGFCSSGNLAANQGIFPLVPSSVILGCNLKVDAIWSAADQTRIDNSLAKGEQVSINNLVIHPEKGKTDLQVIGWVSSLIPLSPK